eukprot:CAMPEP_0116136670 /NCGR_PEP_ID=MMETSP0329-20121206/11851_1 /TAXON_ID=697910 /ORGANISM="Pseudo-nitzschia arenysensis, Strain B593" /LENGTH=346 /DNA_ID=CAMNT_0003631559 /DNA_START=184 /DNA_END=1221 /DNA_ORIENTATION=-
MPPQDRSDKSFSRMERSSSPSSSSNNDLAEPGVVDVEMSLLNDEKESGSTPDTDMGASEWIGFHVKKNGKVLSACASYSFCSVSMVLVNKSLASSYNNLINGDLNVLLVVFQAIVAVLAVKICHRLGWVEIPPFSMETASQWAPVNIFFCGMLFTGMASLQYNSVPMVTIFKNVSNITTSIGDYYFFGNKPENLVIVAFGIMLLGAIAAAWNDISITPQGLWWMALNCLTASGYVLYMKRATASINLTKFGMVFYNNVLCVCFLLPVAMAMGQTKLIWNSDALHTWDYFWVNMFAGVVGFMLNFASLQCVDAAGPTTYVTIGSLNKIPVAFLGYWLFDSAISQETW